MAEVRELIVVRRTAPTVAVKNSEAGSDHGILGQIVGNSGARLEIGSLAVPLAARQAPDAREHLASTDLDSIGKSRRPSEVPVGQAIVPLGSRSLIVPAQAHINGQPWRDLVVVLEVESVVLGGSRRVHDGREVRASNRISQQESGEPQAGRGARVERIWTLRKGFRQVVTAHVVMARDTVQPGNMEQATILEAVLASHH